MIVFTVLLFLAGVLGFFGGWCGRDALARADFREYDRSVLEALRRIGAGRS